MSRDGFKIVESDLHLMEPPNLYDDYMEPEYRALAPRWGARPESGLLDWQVQDGKLPAVDWLRKEMLSRKHLDDGSSHHYAEEKREGYTPGLTLKAMDREGIDIAILFRTYPQMAIQVDGQDPRYSLAVCRAFNNWLSEFVQADPDRLRGSAVLALNDVPAASQEAIRAVKDQGAVAVTLLPTSVDDRMPHDRECDRLWDTLQDLDVPVTFHDTSQGYSARNPGNWFREHPNNLVLIHTFSFPITLMLTIGCMTAGGVLHRFPKLRMAFLEGNCSWVPWLLYRLDEQWKIYGDSQEVQLAHLPSHYFKERCYVSVETDGELLCQVVETIGDDNIVLSTDSPHTDSNYPFALEKFLAYYKVSDATKKKILWDNCARLYKL